MNMHTLPKLAALSLVLSSPAALADDAAPGAGLSVGLRAGYGVPFGKVVDAENGAELSDTLSGVIPLQVDAGFFLSSHLYLGGSFQYGVGILAEDCEVEGEDVSCGARQLRFGLNLAYHFRPDATLSPWLGVGVGYEHLSRYDSRSSLGASREVNTTARGFEFANAQGGLDFRLGNTVSVGPFVTFAVGQYSTTGLRIEVEGDGILGGDVDTTNDIEDKAFHAWLYGGLRLQARF